MARFRFDVVAFDLDGTSDRPVGELGADAAIDDHGD